MSSKLAALQAGGQATPVVIDVGSDSTKVNLATESQPIVFPSLVMHGKQKGVSTRVGDDAMIAVGNSRWSPFVRLVWPVRRGVATDMGDIAFILDHAFNSQLRTSPEEHPVLLADAPNNPKGNREAVAEILFETREAPALLFAQQPVLSLYARGRTAGVVLESGHGATHAVCIADGQAVSNTAQRLDFGGDDLTTHLQQLLAEMGYSFTTSAERSAVRAIKEAECAVALDLAAEMKHGADSRGFEKNYELPDGQVISLKDVGLRCTEPLFQPSLLQTGRANNASGLLCSLPELVRRSVASAHPSLAATLYSNIVLSGGNTAFRGMAARFEKEIKMIAPAAVKPAVCAVEPRQVGCWTGGAIFAQAIAQTTAPWILLEEYQEYGVGIVHIKSL